MTPNKLKIFFVYCLGVFACLWFWGFFLYAVGFFLNFYVPKSIDSGSINSVSYSIVVNTLLIFLFGFQHSIMARSAFKKLLVKLIPRYFERTFYVLLANLTLSFIFIFWQPIPIPIWSINNLFLQLFIYFIFMIGCFILAYSLIIIGHFDFIGLRQIYLHFKKKAYTPVDFKMPTIYKYIRHPMYLGTLMAFWATPEMTLGHLFFAIGMTLYTVIGIKFEERDLIKLYGNSYKKYSQTVGMFLPKI